MANMSTFPDYCLSCDRQIDSPGEVYCSQQCRLADLCTSPSSSNTSIPPTPATSSTPHQSTYPSSSSPSRTVNRHGPSCSVSSTSSSGVSRNTGNAFVLPPAYDFSSHRNSTASNASSSSVGSMASSQRSGSSITAPRPPSGYFAYAGSSNMLLSSSEAAKKTLSPTSSRSSITSVDDIRSELRAYESGFDVTRDWRRRRASVYDGSWRN